MNTQSHGLVRLYDEPFTLGGMNFPEGLYLVTLDKEGNETLRYVGDPLWAISSGRDPSGRGWGLRVKWYSPDGMPNEDFIARSLLIGEGRDALSLLADGGYHFGFKMGPQVLNYLNHQSPSHTVTRVAKLGWIEGTSCFMFPDGPVGATHGDLYEYTGTQPILSQIAGTLDEWQQEVASLCVGNTRLLLCAALAFSGPLLRLTNQHSFGIHLVGPSSIGKSTAMLVAASVAGAPAQQIQTWNATKVGLEVTAGQCNDRTLLLDEMGQADPTTIGDTIYMLANGEGRTRANADLSRRAKQPWLTTFLSNGEIDLQHHLEAVGKKHKAGHDVRLLNVMADAEQGLGLFESLHGFADGASLAKHLGECTARYYGHALRAFVERLVDDVNEACDFVQHHRAEFVACLNVRDCYGQVQRAADALGLISAAGELASRYGVTGWQPGTVREAVIQIFRSWLATRGTRGALEELDIIQRLMDLMQVHRGQFLSGGLGLLPLRENYGYIAGPELHLYPKGFKQVFSGFQPRQVHQVLKKLGVLNHGAGEGLPRVDGHRVYVLCVEKIHAVYDELLNQDGEE